MPDERIAEEIAALDTYLDRTRGDRDRRMACMAMGARTALEWIRDSRRADPMNPMRAISLLEVGLDLPKVLDFTPPAPPVRCRNNHEHLSIVAAAACDQSDD